MLALAGNGKASGGASRLSMITKMSFQECRRTYRYVGVIIIVAACMLCASALRAKDREALIDKLPRGFVGEFVWDGDNTVQNVVMRFDRVQPLNGESAEATGCGAYEVNRRVTKIKVRMLVNWSDLHVQILEQSPEGNDSFTTDGSHRGKLSDDLQKIEARWSGSDGKRGKLHLHAAPSAVCAPATSL
jgi:hypothetical protein